MSYATRSLALSFAFLGLSLGAHAESSLVSSASQSLSTSVGQSSKSISGSSDGSSKHTDVAQGDYHVIDVAAAEGRPGMTAMTLQAVAAGADGRHAQFTLTLPDQTVAQHGLAAGQVVTALARPYGYEFTQAAAGTGTAPRQAFFLVMHDDWYRELDTRRVS